MDALLASMNFDDAIFGRRSVRRYEKRQVPRETVARIIEAAEAAPSAGNLRARKYIVVVGTEMKRALALAAFSQEHVEAAPVVIVVCADVERSSARYGDRGSLYAIQDASVATMCLLLAAHASGLGACWTGAFDDALVREALSLEERVLPVALVPLGWPTEEPSAPPRRDLAEMVRWAK
jgi:nitroreductase